MEYPFDLDAPCRLQFTRNLSTEEYQVDRAEFKLTPLHLDSEPLSLVMSIDYRESYTQKEAADFDPNVLKILIGLSSKEAGVSLYSKVYAECMNSPDKSSSISFQVDSPVTLRMLADALHSIEKNNTSHVH